MTPAQKLANDACSKGQIALTPHAKQMMDLRQISLADIENAITQGDVAAVGGTDRLLVRHGDLRLSLQRRGDKLLVLTALHRADLVN